MPGPNTKTKLLINKFNDINKKINQDTNLSKVVQNKLNDNPIKINPQTQLSRFALKTQQKPAEFVYPLMNLRKMLLSSVTSIIGHFIMKKALSGSV
jgi:hypothetical protein